MNWHETLRESPMFTCPNRVDDLGLLYPPFRDKILVVLKDLKVAGFRPVVFETYRSAARQLKLFNEGASKLKTGGMHQYGVACDLYYANDKDVVQKPVASVPFYHTMRKKADEIGLFYISWDWPHLQLVPPKGGTQAEIYKGNYPA